ncbi:hypothetical protein [Pedobacter gandavensis]|uniref:Uncharacterized protein n=1 Tax=Pedobacter gandavensis TaxID=2679963 RepID=A0ABR6ESK5_9SPHI|nr:hypothetical protein [Pedobacter gandavensis]MBB2148245.1 hypothetical protein [Pedobacter gandavensis]
MAFIGILFALFFAIILTAVFRLFFHNSGSWAEFWSFFVLLFFVSLAAGEWAAPRGPSVWGYYWVPGLISAFVVGLVIVAVSPHSTMKRTRRSKNRKEDAVEEEIREFEVGVAVVVFGVFYCIVIVLLALIALSGLVIKM